MYTNTANAYKMSPGNAAIDRAILDRIEAKRAANRPQSVIAPKTLKCTLGFREAARLVSIAQETGTAIHLVAGKRSASAESMLSLLALGLKEGSSVVLTVKGENTRPAFEKSVDVLDGKVFG